MTASTWKLVLLLAGIFVAGGVAGSFITLRVGHDVLRKRSVPEQWGPARLEMLIKRLDLTPAQIETLRPIVKRNVEELGKLRQQGLVETRRVLERMEREIGAQLTPSQKERFEQLNAERRERWRKLQEQRRQEGGKRERGERPLPPAETEPRPPRPAGNAPGG